MRAGFELPPELLDYVVEKVAERVLDGLAQRERVSGPLSPYMTVEEAATQLRCPRQRIDDLLSQRRLTRVKEGGRTLVSRAEIEAYLVRHKLRGKP